MNKKSKSVRFVKWIEKLSNFEKAAVWLLADLASFVSGAIVAYIFFSGLISPQIQGYIFFTLLAFLLYVAISRLFRLNLRISRYSGMRDLTALFFAFSVF